MFRQRIYPEDTFSYVAAHVFFIQNVTFRQLDTSGSFSAFLFITFMSSCLFLAHQSPSKKGSTQKRKKEFAPTQSGLLKRERICFLTKGSTQKGKNLLPVGANSFLSE